MRILITVDERQRTPYLAAAILRLTRNAPAEVIALRVLNPSEGGRTPEAEAEFAATCREQISKHLTEAGLEATVLTETREPFTRVHQHVLARAKALDVDMIVVASKRVGGVLDTVIGGVAQELVRHSRIPVLVVRPDA